MVPHVRKYIYKGRLGMLTLRLKRKMPILDGVNSEKFFKMSSKTYTVSEGMKIHKPQSRINISKYFYCYMVKDW